jgi:hypothetical protein
MAVIENETNVELDLASRIVCLAPATIAGPNDSLSSRAGEQ